MKKIIVLTMMLSSISLPILPSDSGADSFIAAVLFGLVCTTCKSYLFKEDVKHFVAEKSTSSSDLQNLSLTQNDCENEGELVLDEKKPCNYHSFSNVNPSSPFKPVKKKSSNSKNVIATNYHEIDESHDQHQLHEDSLEKSWYQVPNNGAFANARFSTYQSKNFNHKEE